MSLKVILLDGEAFQNRPQRQSLLSLPMADGCVLDKLIERLGKLSVTDVLIVKKGEGLEKRIAPVAKRTRLHLRLLDEQSLIEVVAQCEIGDQFLIIDPRYWTLEAPDYDLLGDPTEYRGASHVVAIGEERTGSVRELVERDDHGAVKRVQRWYDAVNWPENASNSIIFSRVPAKLLTNIRFKSLSELRNALSDRGVLSRDVPMKAMVYDLQNEQNYLRVNQQMLGRMDFGNGKSRGHHVTENSLGTNRLGHACRVDVGARLIPPVIIQEGAEIDPGAFIMGPAVIGANARIHSGARVLQSVIDADTTISKGETIRHRAILRSDSILEHESPAAPWRIPLRDTSSQDVCQNANSQSDAADELMIASRRGQLFLKRMVDITLSGLGLIVLFPLMLLTAALVWLDSKGPIFFGHRREGRFGKEFSCWKFRTMVVDAHLMQRELYEKNEVDGPQFKLARDPRETRMGRWLRSTNLDELPQLYNVLMGHMSLVGPRPSPFRENQVCVPWRRARLSVRPGISGLWQVCRNQDRSGGDFHEWIYYDIVYVRHFSIWLDFKILLATILSLGGKWTVPMNWLVPEMGQHLGWKERRSQHCHFYPLQPTG